MNRIEREIGLYKVENQYGQSGTAFWDGVEWTDITMNKGSCMLYSDQKIIKASLIDFRARSLDELKE